MPNESDAKIKTLALIIKFGHDLFGCKDVKSVAVSAINNSHILLKFRSSALFKLHKNKKCEVLGQYARTEPDEFSSAILLQKDLLKKTDFDKNNTLILDNDKLPEELAENSSVYLIEKLPPPAAGELEYSYIWLLEYGRKRTDCRPGPSGTSMDLPTGCQLLRHVLFEKSCRRIPRRYALRYSTHAHC